MEKTYEELKKELYENVAEAKSSGIIKPEISYIFDEELDDWCGTPPKIPSPWNPDVFIRDIANSISERIEREGIESTTEKIIGVGAAIAVVRVVGIIAIMASGAHSMGGGR